MKIYIIIILFMIYSFIGWLIEVIDTKIITKKWVNRGFLMGPICPIYGFAWIILYNFLNKYYKDPWVVFGMAIIICSLIEYFTSLIMEKLFHLRWWDYSDKKFNINGRICLETMIPFGILGTIMIYVLNPLFLSIINKIPEMALCIIASIFILLFIVDETISFNLIINIKNITKNIKKDSTEEIHKYVKKILKNHTFFYQRIIKAFPNIKFPLIKKKKK